MSRISLEDTFIEVDAGALCDFRTLAPICLLKCMRL